MTLRSALLLACLLLATGAGAATLDPDGRPLLIADSCMGPTVACARDIDPAAARRHVMLGAPRGALMIMLPAGLHRTDAEGPEPTPPHLLRTRLDERFGSGIITAIPGAADVDKIWPEMPAPRLAAADIDWIEATAGMPSQAAAAQAEPTPVPAIGANAATPLSLGLIALAFLAGRGRRLAGPARV